MDQVNERFEYEEESRNVSRLMNPYANNDAEEYDSDYMGPRKPFMREDRSTSPPEHDPLFRGNRFKSVGVQESNDSLILPKITQKKSAKKEKNGNAPMITQLTRTDCDLTMLRIANAKRG